MSSQGRVLTPNQHSIRSLRVASSISSQVPTLTSLFVTPVSSLSTTTPVMSPLFPLPPDTASSPLKTTKATSVRVQAWLCLIGPRSRSDYITRTPWMEHHVLRWTGSPEEDHPS